MSVKNLPQKHNDIFISPAADSINKNNETGSTGQLSYGYIQSLAKVIGPSKMYAFVMHTYKVGSERNIELFPMFGDEYERQTKFSLIFYLKSFLKYRNSEEYKSSTVVQHYMPFAPGLTFNLFFVFRRKSKRYVLGPILGPHVKNINLKDEQAGADSNLKQLFAKIIFGWLSKKTIHNADLVLFPDQYAFNSFRTYLKAGQHYEIIGYGVGAQIYDAAKNYQPVRRDISKPLNVLFVGRLTERKGARYVIEAIKKLLNDHPESKISCDIVGRGPQDQMLKQLIVDYSLEKIVHMRGGFEGNDEINAYYKSADIVCLPVLSDTWMAAKEALLWGKPVIITDIASHSEHVSDGVNGKLVPVKDPASIAECLHMLGRDNNLLFSMSKAAKSGAEANYDWDRLAKEYSNLLYGKKTGKALEG